MTMKIFKIINLCHSNDYLKCKKKDQFIFASSWCDGVIDCIDRTDESNCFKTTPKPFKDVFIDCTVNESNNYKNYADPGDYGFKCGDVYCLDTLLWCNTNGFRENENLEYLAAICPDLINQIGNPILCSNQTFWNERSCNKELTRQFGNTPGKCSSSQSVKEMESKY